MDNKPRFPIFVYGTLKTGHGNYMCYLSYVVSKSIKAETLSDKFTMLEIPGAYPYVVAGVEGHETGIKGELVWVDEDEYEETLGRLDGLEGVARQHYVRIETPVVDEEGNAYVAWMYMASKATRADLLTRVAGGSIRVVNGGEWRPRA